ncbi:MAG: hypothetical protein JXR73_07760 [Candidatus Omnitrophica bacterium]|nr:hypothetical protein [Candidatus Omnitrophota bacterium]
MNNTQELPDCLKITAQILIRCFWIGFIILFFWFFMILLAHDLIYRIHSSMFHITETQFDVMMYAGLGLTKLFVFFFFLIPYICILWVQAGKKS